LRAVKERAGKVPWRGHTRRAFVAMLAAAAAAVVVRGKPKPEPKPIATKPLWIGHT
jgi:hypothetical protein